MPLPLRPFPRSLWLLALAVVIGHVLTVVFFGATAFGSLLGNALQIFSSLVAALMCFRAARKLSGFSHSFWTLVGFGMCMWGVADLGWTYYEVFLHAEPPPGSIIRFLFHSHGDVFRDGDFSEPGKNPCARGV